MLHFFLFVYVFVSEDMKMDFKDILGQYRLSYGGRGDDYNGPKLHPLGLYAQTLNYKMFLYRECLTGRLMTNHFLQRKLITKLDVI